MIDRLRELRHQYGRDTEPFQIHAGEPTTSSVDAFTNPPDSLQAKIDAVKRFGDEVIAKYP